MYYWRVEREQHILHKEESYRRGTWHPAELPEAQVKEVEEQAQLINKT